MATIFHIALESDWTAAQATGSYTTSTVGHSLADVGFIHASRGDQWTGVRDRFYAEVGEPLVLLHIDTTLLDVPVVEEEGDPGTGETFPHVYGRLPVAAVVKAIPLSAPPAAAPPTTVEPARTAPPAESFSRAYFREMAFNVLMLTIVLVGGLAGAGIGITTDTEWGASAGGLAGIVVGAVIAVVAYRRRHAAK